jgi:hypothetical protein
MNFWGKQIKVFAAIKIRTMHRRVKNACKFAVRITMWTPLAERRGKYKIILKIS